MLVSWDLDAYFGRVGRGALVWTPLDGVMLMGPLGLKEALPNRDAFIATIREYAAGPELPICGI